MKNYKKILVLENDSEHIGMNYFIKIVNSNEDVSVDMWYNFSVDINNNRDKSFKRFKNLSEDILLVSNPSFVGVGNSLSSYIVLFLMMARMDIKLDLAIIDYDGFKKRLIDFLYSERSLLKNQNNHNMLRTVLDTHNIYEINTDDLIHDKKIIDCAKLITWENVNSYYYETHRKLPKLQFKVIETGEIYPLIYVNNHKNKIDKFEFELIHSTSPFKSQNYLLSELELIK